MNRKQTSPKVASTAWRVLQDGRFSDVARSLGGCALSQASMGKEPSAQMAKLASQVLQSDRYSDTTQGIAASVLSQSNPQRK